MDCLEISGIPLPCGIILLLKDRWTVGSPSETFLMSLLVPYVFFGLFLYQDPTLC